MNTLLTSLMSSATASPLIAAIIAAIAFFFVLTANSERTRKLATLVTYLAITGTIVISASNALQYNRTIRTSTAALSAR